MFSGQAARRNGPNTHPLVSPACLQKRKVNGTQGSELQLLALFIPGVLRDPPLITR